MRSQHTTSSYFTLRHSRSTNTLSRQRALAVHADGDDVLRQHAGELDTGVTYFAPRFGWRDRLFYALTLVRRLTPISGNPRIRIRLRPRFDYGATAPIITHGSHHIRYVGPNFTLRLTTDAPIDFIRDEAFFNLNVPIDLILGPDETLSDGVMETARSFEERTRDDWLQWVHRLAIPFEWQDAVIRAAISLKLCT